MEVTQILLEKIPQLSAEQQQLLLSQVEVLLDEDKIAEDASVSIWEKIRQRGAALTNEEWSKIPADGAAQHDPYIYGAPKR